MLEYRKILNEAQMRRTILTDSVNKLKLELGKLADEIRDHEAARDAVNAVTVATQEQVKEFVEQVVTKALGVVFGDQYGCEVIYEIKRNKSEAKIVFTKDGERFDPKEEVGGGVLDTASLGFRFALWALADPKPSPIFILDEPGKWVSRDKIEAFGQMLKEVSTMFGIQVIMVSHDDSLIACADRAFEVTQSKGVSSVEMV